jgi:hypothetical protein
MTEAHSLEKSDRNLNCPLVVLGCMPLASRHSERTTESISDPQSGPLRSLDEQRAEYARRRGLAMPLAGAIIWTLIGIAGAFLPPILAAWSLFIGTGFIAFIGITLSRFTGENFLDRNKPKNAFDSLFFHCVAMALFVYAIAIPFFRVDYTSLPLTVGILTGLMWIPFSWIIHHWVGIFHTAARTVLVTAVWYLAPHHRFVVVPAVIVGVYAVTIVILQQRWRSSISAGAPSAAAPPS